MINNKGKGGASVVEALRRKRKAKQRQVRHDPAGVPRYVVYQELPAFSVVDGSVEEKETTQQEEQPFRAKTNTAKPF